MLGEPSNPLRGRLLFFTNNNKQLTHRSCGITITEPFFEVYLQSFQTKPFCLQCQLFDWKYEKIDLNKISANQAKNREKCKLYKVKG